jgi:putative DNA primase/helicase
MDSYAEVSPSGKGVHVIVKGKVAQGRRRNKIEVYSSSRYMTMTGVSVSR